MKRALAGSFVAAAFAASLSAQTPAPPTSQAQEPKDAAKSVTVTGCLKAGDTADSYTLSNLKWGQSKAIGTSGSTAGATTPSTGAAPVSATALKLVGSPAGTKLGDHVGHTIEVTGTISDKADKPMGSTSPATPPAAGAAAGASASMSPALNVNNVKMVSATCTP
jgi:hypothetical protein